MKPASCFKNLKLEPEYRNINEIVTINDRLHMCETLFGDLNAELMVLGQDGAPFEVMNRLVVFNEEGANGYRHGPDVQTNINLIKCLSNYTAKYKVDGNIGPKTCGVFYANAVWLLKEGENMDAPLRRLTSVLRKCTPVMQATIEGLPNLKLIIAFGKVAYESLRLIDPSLNQNWREMVDGRAVCNAKLFGNNVKIGTVLHPSRVRGDANVSKLKSNFECLIQKAGLGRASGEANGV